jgi:hypothetical protein
MAVVEEDKNHLEVVAAGQTEKVVDAVLEAARIVAPYQVM